MSVLLLAYNTADMSSAQPLLPLLVCKFCQIEYRYIILVPEEILISPYAVDLDKILNGT